MDQRLTFTLGNEAGYECVNSILHPCRGVLGFVAKGKKETSRMKEREALEGLDCNAFLGGLEG